MSSNITVSAIQPSHHYLPPMVESAIETIYHQDFKALAFHSMDILSSIANPFSRLEEHDRQLKLMNKSVKVKRAIIRDAEKKAKTFKAEDPKKAEHYQNIADKLKQSLVATEAKRDYVANDKKIERVGKFSTLTERVIPGSGLVLTAAYSVGKVVNAASYALNPKVDMSEKIEKVKSVSKDLAITGALMAGSVLSVYAWSLIA